MTKRGKIFIIAAVAAGVIALSWAAKRHRVSVDRAALNALETDTFIVTTEKAQKRDLQERLVLTGTVKALDEAVLYPRVSGKLLKNLLKEGDPVRRDEPVALVERDEVGAVYEAAPVPSTLTGVVGRTYQDVGANLTPQTPIALVVDQSKVRIKVDLPERYLGEISPGQSAEITVDPYPDRRFSGKIYKISPVIDMDNRSVPIEVLAENPDRKLKSGMFAQVNLLTGQKSSALSVSAQALQSEEKKGAFLFMAVSGKAALRAVKTGIKTPEYVEITEGLKAGDEVINSGLYGLKEGSKIEFKK